MGFQGSGFSEADWAKLRRITEHAPDVTMVLDTECQIQFINWTAPGLSVDQVLGTSVYTYVPADQHAAMRTCFRTVRETGQPGGYGNVYDAPGGGKLEWESRVAPITDGGEVIGFTVFSRDVTQRNASDRERTRFFDLSVDMLCVAADGYFKRVSPSFSTVLGFSEEELLSRPFMELIHPDDRARSEEILRGLLAGQEVIDFEIRIQCRKGGYKLISWRSRADTATGRIYAVGRDITTQRTLETQVREAQKMDAIGQLAGGIAHDFNNLMLSVLVNAEFAGEAVGDDSELAEFLTEITRAGQRATALTKQLLAFSRSESLQTIELDLNQLTEGMLQMLRRLLPASIELDFIPGNRLPHIRADKNQIEQVLLNLCVNARDAMPNGGRLTIETETVLVNGRFRESYPWAKPGRYVLLSVTDTGCGMSKDITQRIFEPFFTTKPTGKGTGLGLATVYAILKQHDGMVHVYSEPDVGSTFKVYLPAATRMATAVGSKADPGRPGLSTR